MSMDNLLRNGPPPPVVQPKAPPSTENLPDPSPPPDRAPSEPVAMPGADSRAWTDLLTRADVVMTEVGDLAHDAANGVLEVAFWSQDLKAFEATVVRMEKFARVIRRARQCRPYMTHPETEARMVSVFDTPRSLEAYDAREAFITWAGSLWKQYARMAGPFIQENHPDLL